jgi:hypothetical protein
MKKIPALLIILSFNISISHGISKSGSGVSGFQQAKLPTSMMLPQVVQTKTKCYVISQGNTEYFRKQFNIASNALGSDTEVIVYEFMPANASLRKLSGAGFVRSFFGACINGNKIYIAGGFDSKGKPTSSLFEYDITSKKCTEKNAMFLARTRFALECVGGKLYAIGGENTNGSIEVYKPETDIWELVTVKYIPVNLKPMLDITASAVIENKICLLGPSVFQIFTPGDGIQAEGSTPPMKSKYFDVAVYSKKIYVAGGTTNMGNDDGIYLYNSVEGTWSNVGKIPAPRYGAGLTYFSSMLIYLGGSTVDYSSPAEPNNEIYIYRPSK